MKKMYSTKSVARFFSLAMLAVLIFAAANTPGFAAGNSNGRNLTTADLWSAVDVSQNGPMEKGRRLIVPEKYSVFRVDRSRLEKILSSAPLEFSDASQNGEIIFELPTPDGGLERFRLEESPVLAPNVAAQFPTWKTFSGQGIDDPSAMARFDINANGFHGYVSGSRGTYLVNPYSEFDRDNFVVYYKSDLKHDEAFACRVDGGKSSDLDFEDTLGSFRAPEFSNGTNLRTLRLAVSATKEYTNFYNGNVTTAFAAITTSVNRMNLIYRRELAVTFTLVSNTSTVFTNANNGGFPDAGNAQVADLSLPRNQVVLDGAYGDANYDIGHAVARTGNPNGLAASPSICSTGNKAQGFTGAQVPQGDGYDVDYLAHEIGHQFGMSHTFNNSVDGSCTTRSADSSFEPASGVTIMGYGGICAPRNLSANSIEFFHARSIEQSLGELATNAPAPGGTCGTTTNINNVAPAVNAGGNFTIPKLTPFTLTGSATDTTNNGLTYAWEEYDLGAATASTGAVDTDASGARPIFRSYNPSASPSRTFPSLVYILNNANTPPATYTTMLPNAPTVGSTNGYNCAAAENCITGESLPSIARTMNFRMTVRDNFAAGGGIADATAQVTVVNTSGPFQVTVQNTAPIAWATDSTQTVTWDVAGTAAAPISAANVKISLSTDGGLTFPTTLLASTPNDGTEPVTIPNTPTTQARIKVEAVGNIFFDINNVNFTIGNGAGVVVGNATAPERPLGSSKESPAATEDFPITLSAPSNQTVTVRVSTNSLTATEGSDFVAVDDFDVVFPPGTVTRTVSVPLIDDDVYEGTETFALDVVAVSNAVVIDGEGIGTIVENDPLPGPFEGDINRASAGVAGFGSGDVNIGDQIQFQRFLSGADCPATTEQRRLDAGPRATLGDGLLGSTDGTAIDAYARHDGATDFNPNVAGWQPTPAGGPAAITNLGCTPTTAPERSAMTRAESPANAAARVVRIVSRTGGRNSDIIVDVEIAAQGNEAGTQFGLHFDPTVLRISGISGVNANPDIMLGSGAPAGTSLNVNAEDAANGNIGINENFNAGNSAVAAILEGSTRIARLKFHVLDGAASGASRVTFDDSVIRGATSDIYGMMLAAHYDQSGVVTVGSAAGLTVSGRVTSPDGRGVRNAMVSIVDGDGVARTVTTSSFGFYTFDGVLAATYRVAVASRQYRFASRTIVLGDDLADVNFTGSE